MELYTCKVWDGAQINEELCLDIHVKFWEWEIIQCKATQAQAPAPNCSVG